MDEDRRRTEYLHAINPEAGFFGVAPGTGNENQPQRDGALQQEYDFHERGDDRGARAVVGRDQQSSAGGIDELEGRGVGPPKGTAAHPNARYTVPAHQSPTFRQNGKTPEGVPISAFIFGGRRARVAPLVYEGIDWQHGVFVGATMAGETTAAATGNVGLVRRDPMAMLPFCGYNMADYFGHWLEMGKRIPHPPKIFHVNWFRKGADGKFLWPGYGENVRVLKWILDRTEGRAAAVETAIGLVPSAESLPLEGLPLSAKNVQELLRVDAGDWLPEHAAIGEFLERFRRRLPEALRKEHQRFGHRLHQSVPVSVK